MSAARPKCAVCSSARLDETRTGVPWHGQGDCAACSAQLQACTRHTLCAAVGEGVPFPELAFTVDLHRKGQRFSSPHPPFLFWQLCLYLTRNGCNRQSRTHPGRSYHPPRDIKSACPCTPRTRPSCSPCNSARTRSISRAPIPPPRSCDDAGVAGAGGSLADEGNLARKSVKAPSLLDPGVSIASEPPLYTQVDHWSCSVALRPPLTWLSLMRMREAVLRRGSLLRQNRQPSLRCTPHVCPGRLHSAFTPTYTLGHAPFPSEHEIVIFAPAAPILKVVLPPSKSRPAIRAGSPRFVARSDSHW